MNHTEQPYGAITSEFALHETQDSATACVRRARQETDSKFLAQSAQFSPLRQIEVQWPMC
ncbi:hypothetical protein BAQU_0576 [Bifidobacterium aquikefiri]|uniref:Uncharacterized protein n=1 Tax=Bifidobacterium aquikefiri TaxID=1653207 RepID=A0A261G927_9BIFI|nr:hypothetical protein BAQU_0576 [Bifidobacterium aquikefiri]